MKRVLKFFGYLLLGFVIIMTVGYCSVNRKLPTGTQGDKAEALAQKMLAAVDKPAWDTTHVISWTFRGAHKHLWDKQRHLAQVEWKDYKALVDVNTVTGKVWEKGEEITDTEKSGKLVRKAWEYFLNDSYWLNPVVKIFDPGTERRIVDLEDGKEGLMVTYTSGGTTPGDSYLWILDDNHLPTAWRMWVKIIPVGGMETSWEGWMTLPTGAKVATEHKSKIISIPLTDIKAATSLKEYGFEEDPFSSIAK